MQKALLPRFIYRFGEEASFPFRIANYGKTDLSGPLSWSLDGKAVRVSGKTESFRVPAGSLSAPVRLRMEI